MINKKNIKICFFPANTKKAHNAVKILKKKHKNYSIQSSDVVVAIGGDGTVLSALHKSIKFCKFYFS